MKKLQLCWLAILCLAGNTFAQTFHPPRHLQIGDTLPPVTLTGMQNYPTDTLALASLRDKLIILDFWSTWCAACIESFPKMQSLQETFAGDIQVILVNTFDGDSLGRVQPFLAKRTFLNGTSLQLPYSLQQYRLDTLFPRRYIPHYVWIKPGGVVAAITGNTEITDANIRQALRGNFALREKRDILDFDARQPLFVNGNGGHGDSFIGRSLLTGYQDGLGGRSGIQKNKEGLVTRIYAINSTPLVLLRMAINDMPLLKTTRLKNHSRHENWLHRDLSPEQRFFSYELILPPVRMAHALRFMREDLERYWGISLAEQTLTTTCWVLYPSPSLTTVKSRTAKPRFAVSEKDQDKKILHQTPAAIAGWLEYQTGLPVLDETGITGALDLSLGKKLDWTDRPAILAAFKKAGLVIKQEQRAITYVVIADR